MKNLRYILVDRQVVACPDTVAWALGQGDEDSRRVALTVIGDTEVSTVFIGLDMSHGRAPRPLVFETMVFVDGEATEHHRHATWEEAAAGHREVCADVAAWAKAKQAAPRQ